MKKKKKNKLIERAQEVDRLNMLEGVYRETLRVGQPSAEFVEHRLQTLRENLG